MISTSSRRCRTITGLLLVVAGLAACAGPAPPGGVGGEGGAATAQIAGEPTPAADAAPAVESPTEIAASAPAPVPTDPFWPPPLDLRLALELDFEHGCSQSFENRGATAALALTVAADGAATLTLELDESNVFGPAEGRFQQGDREFHHRYWKERDTWRGRATERDGVIEIAFDRRVGARAELPRYGERKLPADTASKSELRLACRPVMIDAYAASAGDGFAHMVKEGELSTSTPALACRPSAELFELIDLLYADGALPFGRGAGLAVGNWVMFGRHQLVVRQGRPAPGSAPRK